MTTLFSLLSLFISTFVYPKTEEGPGMCPHGNHSPISMYGDEGPFMDPNG